MWGGGSKIKEVSDSKKHISEDGNGPINVQIKIQRLAWLTRLYGDYCTDTADATTGLRKVKLHDDMQINT